LALEVRAGLLLVLQALAEKTLLSMG